MEELAEGKYVRYRSSEDMISEIEFLTGQYLQMKYTYLDNRNGCRKYRKGYRPVREMGGLK
jgi:hypothetical protein